MYAIAHLLQAVITERELAARQQALNYRAGGGAGGGQQYRPGQIIAPSQQASLGRRFPTGLVQPSIRTPLTLREELQQETNLYLKDY